MARPQHHPKFTRGEKCIFVHIIVTFGMTLTLVCIYFIHLLLVDHKSDEIFRITRKSNEHTSGSETLIHFEAVGVVYLNTAPLRGISNILLLREQWSLAPAHCVSIRSDPDLSHYFPLWKIKYTNGDSNVIESDIKRSIVHSDFNRDDFSNNIGLFQHKAISGRVYSAPNNAIFYRDSMHMHTHAMVAVGWNFAVTMKGDFVGRSINTMQSMSPEKCYDFISPIIDNLRRYEFCVTFTNKNENQLNNGALFAVNNQIVGFFSWGDRTGKGVPIIILNISQFTDWIENIITI